jgi:hypothetical protein
VTDAVFSKRFAARIRSLAFFRRVAFAAPLAMICANFAFAFTLVVGRAVHRQDFIRDFAIGGLLNLRLAWPANRFPIRRRLRPGVSAFVHRLVFPSGNLKNLRVLNPKPITLSETLHSRAVQSTT